MKKTQKIMDKSTIKKEVTRLGYKLEHLGFKFEKSKIKKQADKENNS